MPHEVPLAILSHLVYFEGLPDATLDRLASQALRHVAQAGQLLFLEGAPSEGLWIVEQGRVKIYKLHPDGQEHILRIFAEGDTFNDISALDGGHNPVNAAALSDCVLWTLSAQVFNDLILSDSRFALRVIRVLSGRVRGLIRQMEELALYSVLVRLARLLLKQADDPSLSGPGVTRAALASHLASTPQTISTILRELEKVGAIAFNRHEIRIVDEDLLRSLAML